MRRVTYALLGGVGWAAVCLVFLDAALEEMDVAPWLLNTAFFFAGVGGLAILHIGRDEE